MVLRGLVLEVLTLSNALDFTKLVFHPRVFISLLRHPAVRIIISLFQRSILALVIPDLAVSNLCHKTIFIIVSIGINYELVDIRIRVLEEPV